MYIPRIKIPTGYSSVLDVTDTQTAIIVTSNTLGEEMCMKLDLSQVVSPILTQTGSGYQDDLFGTEKPVEFDAPSTGEKKIQILHDNCKWRREYLTKRNFSIGTGVYSVLECAIRREETIDNTHSILINNATWEKVICTQNRNLAYLKGEIQKIVAALNKTQNKLIDCFPKLMPYFSNDCCMISSQELEDRYPNCDPPEREYLFGKKCGIMFCVIGIGYPLRSGHPHGYRTPDYDDWNLNYDLLVYYPPLDQVIEIGGGGIRVGANELRKQLNESSIQICTDTPYHKKILSGEMLLTVGGAMGLNRITMILTNKCHIGEVKPSIWDSDTIATCERSGVELL